MSKKFQLVTASGTFDHFHKGHEAFLQKAFSLSRNVLIGITSDAFVRKKPLHVAILPYEKRKGDIVKFLKTHNLLGRAHIVKLNDVYGPILAKECEVEAILVTSKTRKGAQLINRKRKALSLSPLAVVEVALIRTKGNVISSSKKRATLLLGKNLLLPPNLRSLLRKPLGSLVRGREDNLSVAIGKVKSIITKNPPLITITVGDVVTRSFNEAALPIDLAIVDFKIRREEKVRNLLELGFSKEKPDRTYDNPPGTVSSALSRGIQEVLGKRTRKHKPLTIRVFGEEDLAVLPAIIFSKEDSAIFYGQPAEGIVYIRVDEPTKNRTLSLLSQFTT